MVLNVIPGNDLAVPYAVGLDKTLHWIWGWGNQVYWAVKKKEFLESFNTHNCNQKIMFQWDKHLQVCYRFGKLQKNSKTDFL